MCDLCESATTMVASLFRRAWSFELLVPTMSVISISLAGKPLVASSGQTWWATECRQQQKFLNTKGRF